MRNNQRHSSPLAKRLRTPRGVSQSERIVPSFEKKKRHRLRKEMNSKNPSRSINIQNTRDQSEIKEELNITHLRKMSSNKLTRNTPLKNTQAIHNKRKCNKTSSPISRNPQAHILKNSPHIIQNSPQIQKYSLQQTLIGDYIYEDNSEQEKYLIQNLSNKILGDLINCTISFKGSVIKILDSLLNQRNIDISNLEINSLPLYGFVSQRLCQFLSKFRAELQSELNDFYSALENNLNLGRFNLNEFNPKVTARQIITEPFNAQEIEIYNSPSRNYSSTSLEKLNVDDESAFDGQMHFDGNSNARAETDYKIGLNDALSSELSDKPLQKPQFRTHNSEQSQFSISSEGMSLSQPSILDNKSGVGQLNKIFDFMIAKLPTKGSHFPHF